MRPLTIRIAMLTGLGAIAMTAPAVASPTVSGSIDTRPHAAATQQYAQDYSHGMRGTLYQSKKCKKSDKKCKAKTKPKSDKDKDKG